MSQSMKALKAMIEEGISGKEAAERYGISPAAVSKAKRHPSEIEQLRQRVQELEGIRKAGYDIQDELREQLAAKDAVIEKLRSALQTYIDADDWMAMMCSIEAHHVADEALAATERSE